MAKNKEVAKGNILEAFTPSQSTIAIRRDAELAKLAMFPDIKFLEPLPFDIPNA